MAKPSDMNKYFNKKPEEKKEEKNLTPTAVNKYQINVEIGDIKLSDEDGNAITYKEMCDYSKNNFPVRILTLKVNADAYHKINALPKETVNGFGDMVKVILDAHPVSADGFMNKPFMDGEFLGMMKTSDSSYDYQSVSDTDSPVYKSQNADMKTEITINLFRPSELRFATSNKLNTLYNNATLNQIFFNSFTKTNPGIKLVVSKFDHDPNLGILPLRNMSFRNLIDFLESEVGFYKTDYMCFLEHNLFFFLNKLNNINVNYKALERNIHIEPARFDATRKNRSITKIDDYNYACTTDTGSIKVSKPTNKSFNNSYAYQTPSGKMINYENALSRNVITIYKATEAVPIQKTPTIRYEYIDLSVLDNSVSFINPLTRLTYTDSTRQIRIFRVIRKEIEVLSSLRSSIKLKGLRVIE